MSILIKGIDMPKNGEITIAFASDENGENTMVLIVDDKGKSVEHKGVTEIPAPHGRLVDSNELLDDFMKAYPVGSPDLGCAFEIIENAETFIKAEA